MISSVKVHTKIILIITFVVLNSVLSILLTGEEVNVMKEDYAQTLHDLSHVQPSFGALGKFFVKLAEEQGAVYAFEVLKRAPLPPNMDLHLLGHIVGDELYKQQGIEGMKYCTPDFRNACSHTIVVNGLLADGLGVFEHIHEVCKQSPGGSGAYTMCFHGFGHGVLAYTGYEVSEAVPLCKQTGTAAYQNQEYIECVGGITMEMTSGINDRDLWQKKREDYIIEGNPLSLCQNDAFPDEVKGVCYVYITPELFRAAGADLESPNPNTFEKAFSYCNQLPERDTRNRDACFGGFGKEFTVLVQDRDIRKIDQTEDSKLALVDAWCGYAGNAEGRKSCLSHALDSLYWGGENSPDVSIRFCTILEDASDKSDCFENLVSNVSHYVSDTTYREQFCSSIPDEFSTRCRSRLK